MTAKHVHRPVDHGLAADLAILLGASGAGAQSAPGGDEDGCSAVRSGHHRSMRGVFRVALGAPAHSPYHAGGLKTERFLSPWEKQFLLQCTCAFDRTV
jgi:hypothetical protein